MSSKEFDLTLLPAGVAEYIQGERLANEKATAERRLARLAAELHALEQPSLKIEQARTWAAWENDILQPLHPLWTGAMPDIGVSGLASVRFNKWYGAELKFGVDISDSELALPTQMAIRIASDGLDLYLRQMEARQYVIDHLTTTGEPTGGKFRNDDIDALCKLYDLQPEVPTSGRHHRDAGPAVYPRSELLRAITAKVRTLQVAARADSITVMFAGARVCLERPRDAKSPDSRFSGSGLVDSVLHAMTVEEKRAIALGTMSDNDVRELLCAHAEPREAERVAEQHLVADYFYQLAMESPLLRGFRQSPQDLVPQDAIVAHSATV